MDVGPAQNKRSDRQAERRTAVEKRREKVKAQTKKAEEEETHRRR